MEHRVLFLNDTAYVPANYGDRLSGGDFPWAFTFFVIGIVCIKKLNSGVMQN